MRNEQEELTREIVPRFSLSRIEADAINPTRVKILTFLAFSSLALFAIALPVGLFFDLPKVTHLSLIGAISFTIGRMYLSLYLGQAK